jgi:hypothetical protein
VACAKLKASAPGGRWGGGHWQHQTRLGSIGGMGRVRRVNSDASLEFLKLVKNKRFEPYWVLNTGLRQLNDSLGN